MTKDKLLLDKIKKQINKAQVISFDIFDTLLVRPYVRPTDLFVHMEKAYERPGFAAERKDAERRTRFRHKELEDVTFDMIYDEIDAEFKDMKQKEMDWEEMVLRANPELKQVYDYALEQGKKVIITSDMYLPTEFLAKVLRKNGFDNWDKLYVSGDIGKMKSHASLYFYVLDSLSISPEKILHIGDNKKSDMEIPKTIGFKTILYKKFIDRYISLYKNVKQFLLQRPTQLGSSILISLFGYQWIHQYVVHGNRRSYWENLGYYYTGPLAYSFMRFVEKDAKEKKLNHLLFAARSGFILHKIFKIISPNIKTNYVYAPRFFKIVCFLQFDTYIEYQKLINYFCKKSIKINKKYKGLYNKTEENLQLFFHSNRKLFEQVANQNARNYTKYLKNIVKNDDKVAIIDDSANTFSGQSNLERSLGKKIYGYYFTVLDTKFTPLFDYSAFHETIYKRTVKNNDINTRSWCWSFVEFLLSAPEYPVADITENGIVHSSEKNEYEEYRCKLSGQMCNGAENFAKDIKNFFQGNDIFIEFRTIVEWINSFLLNPTDNDYNNWKNVTFDWFAFNSDRHDFLVRDKYKYKLLCTHKDVMMDTKFYWDKTRGIIYDQDARNNKKIIRILGIPIYKKEILASKIKTKILSGLVKKVETGNNNLYYLLGMKIHQNKNSKKVKCSDIDVHKLHNSIICSVAKCISINDLHKKTFSGYKYKYTDKTIVLVGAGPTVNYYQPLKNVINVGTNRAFLRDDIVFKYLFAIDKAGLETISENYYQKFLDYDAVKFIGDQNMGKYFQIPESVLAKHINIYRYQTTANLIPSTFTKNIDSEPLGNFASVALQAIQFILYTNPKTIYLVGIDCTASSKQHFTGATISNLGRNESLANNDKINIFAWKKLKEFVETYYPETEIISVNPVGLKGIFRDVYTKEYLYRHPEIDEKSVEIINTENKE